MRNGNQAKVFWVTFITSVAMSVGSPLQASLIANGSFETVTPSTTLNEICASPGSGYPYQTCSATGWTGSYQLGNGQTAGIGGSSFGIPQPDPNGSQALILQGHGSSATQTGIGISASGLYSLTFDLANRNTPGLNGAQTVEVLWDNNPLAGGTYSGIPYSWTGETLVINASAGKHSLEFEGIGPSGKDITAFVDNVSLASKVAGVPEPSSLCLLAVGGLLLGASRLRFR